MFLSARRFLQAAVVFQPITFLRLKNFLVRQKYKLLFSGPKRSKRGPKGPAPDIIAAVVDFKKMPLQQNLWVENGSGSLPIV